jgi:hypothetical protein
MRHSSRFVLSVAVVSILAVRGAIAQVGIVVQPTQRDTLTVEPGSTVTVAFDVRNGTSTAVIVQPQIALPKGWSVVIGSAAFGIAAQSRDTWLVGVAPGPAVTAGTYTVRATVVVGSDPAQMDSVVIRVPERHGLDVYPGETPPFVMGGGGFPVRFFVHNNGNVVATFALRATTSLGMPLSLDQQSVTVQPGATATITSRAPSSRPELRTRESVVELTAVDRSDSTISSSASVRTTMVPRSIGWLDQVSTVPSELMLRSVGRGSGVSPASFSGSGPLSPGGNTQLDFLFRAPVDGPPIFGERDEYRVSLSADPYRVRLGDQLFGFSQLTSSWTPGFGAELSGERSGMTVGAYVKENRFDPTQSVERALSLGTSAAGPFSASIVGVDRGGDGGPGARVGALSARARLGGRSVLEVEGAMSDSAGSPGEAHRARLAGDVSLLTYDLSFIHGTREYAGRDRGETMTHAGVSAKLTDWATVSGNASTFAFSPMLAQSGSNRLKSGILEGSFLCDRFAVAYESMTRNDSGSYVSLDGAQRGLRIRATQPVGPLDFSTSVAEGVAHDAGVGDHRYESITLSMHTRLGDAGSLELFGQRTAGTIFEMPGSNGGATATLQLPQSTSLVLSAFGNVPFGERSMYFAQLDAELSHRLDNGMLLVLRNRLTRYAWRTEGPRSNLIFLELRAPLRIPTGRGHPTSVARGRIVDEETGMGVGGALVRLGSEAAVSDAHGRVTFASLAPGRYQASVDGAAGPRMSDALLIGDVAVDVPTESRRPVDFSLSLVRGGHVRVGVRQLDFATTLATAAADSLVDAGGFANAVIALVGARDTIYQITNQDGVADFRDIPVGRWSVKMIAGALPSAHAVDEDELAVTVRPGERATVGFRVVPKRRAIQLMNPQPPVVARPAPSPDKP